MTDPDFREFVGAGDMLCTQCWGVAKPLYVNDYLHGWLCECGHFDKATGRERWFREAGNAESDHSTEA